MVKQYVGARYVPKFASPVEWAADTSYEALTIVTFNNASYTSKVPVPPTVGNPANNPQYWALTGNYNAQVEEYRQEVVNIAKTVKGYNFVTPEDYGAKGNGLTDDSNAILKAFNDAKNNKKILLMPNTYAISSPIELDGYNETTTGYNKVPILNYGKLIINATIKLQRISDSIIYLTVDSSSITDAAVQLDGMESCVFLLYGARTNGTCFKIASNKANHRCTYYLNCSDCHQSYVMGNAITQAVFFGSITSFIYQEEVGSILQNLSDVQIKSFDYFGTATPCLTIKNSGSVFVTSMEIGGSGDRILDIDHSDLYFNTLFVNSENHKDLIMANAASLYGNLLFLNNAATGITLTNRENKRIQIANIITSNVDAPYTGLNIHNDAVNLTVTEVPENNEYCNNENVVLSRTNNSVQLAGELHIIKDLPAYTAAINIPIMPLYTGIGTITTADGTATYTIQANQGANSAFCRNTLPVGTYFVNLTYNV